MAIFAPCHESQAIFRTLLMAISHPGRRYAVEPSVDGSGAHLLLFQVAGCLMDHEVTFALSDGWQDTVHGRLAQHTGARPANWEHADFVFVAGGTSDGRAAAAKRGSLAYPDKGATLIYFIPALTEAGADDTLRQRVRLSGPGIEHPAPPGLTGLFMAEYSLLREANADYPLGVDTFLIQGDRYIMGLPRSTRIEVE